MTEPEMIRSADARGFVLFWNSIAEHVAARERISFASPDYNVGEKIALVHSELSEGLEAYRKDLEDDHIPGRPGLEVELGDAVIRIMGIGRRLGYDIPGAILDKAAFNDVRADHKADARGAAHGKRF